MASPIFAVAPTPRSQYRGIQRKSPVRVSPLETPDFRSPIPPGGSGVSGAPGMGRIARHSRRVAAGEPNERVRAMRPSEPTVADRGLCRMARGTQRLHVRWIEVGPITTPWHDVIDVCSDNPTAGHFAIRPGLQHRRPEAPPSLALIEAVSGHRRCIQSSQKNRFHPGRAALAAF